MAYTMEQLQAQWQQNEARKSPQETVEFMVRVGYTPFVMLPTAEVIIWVRKEYETAEDVFPAERYAIRDLANQGGVRYLWGIDTSGLTYSAAKTLRKLTDYYGIGEFNFAPAPLDSSIMSAIESGSLMLIDNGVVCKGSLCVEQAFIRELYPKVKVV